MQMGLFVSKIEKRPGSGVWVTASRGGEGGESVTYNIDKMENCPTMDERILVTIDRPNVK